MFSRLSSETLRKLCECLNPPNLFSRLSSETLRKLCECLNPPNSRANDWRMLAKMMQVDRSVGETHGRGPCADSLSGISVCLGTIS